MRTGRPRSFDRDEALDQAMLVFWEHGFEASSVAMLTSAMGIGAPSLYAGFGDKRSLFFESLSRYLERDAAFTVAALTEEQCAYDAVARLLREAAVAYTRPDRPHGCLLTSATTNCSPQSGDVASRLREIRAAGTKQLHQKLRRAVRTGELPKGTNVNNLAIFYAATLNGMSAQARDGATTKDLRSIADAALLAWPTTTPH